MTTNAVFRLRWRLLGVAAVTALVVLSVTTALAAVTGALTLGTSSVLPGASTTVDASFSEDAVGGVLGGTIVSVIVTPQAGATGTVTLDTADVTCVPASGPQVDCLWSTGSSSKSVTLSATASADALGTFNITTQVEGDDPDTDENDIVVRQVQSTTLDVATATTTTTTPTTTTPTTTVPATTSTVPASTTTTIAVVQTDIPDTGPAGGIPIVLVAVGFTTLGILAVRFNRASRER